MNVFGKLAIVSAVLSLSAQAVVIGRDDREVVTKHDKSTWGIGVVYANYGKDTIMKCTGTLISTDHVLTSGHCVYDLKHGGFPKSISFVPGQLSTDSEDDHRYIAESVWVDKEFKKFRDEKDNFINGNYDVALLKLQRGSRGDQPGVTYGYKGFVSQHEESGYVSNLSYPSIGKDYHTLMEHKKCSYKLEDNVYISDCDTNSGSSGSAILNKNKQIIGLLSFGKSSGNVFTRLNDEYENQIASLVNGANASFFTKRDLDTKKYFSVHLRNNCHKTIYLAYSYKGLDNEWKKDGFVKMAPGEIYHNAIQTQNTVIAFYGQTYDGDISWYGTDVKLEIRGETYDFYYKNLPKDMFVDKTFSWSCSGY